MKALNVTSRTSITAALTVAGSLMLTACDSDNLARVNGEPVSRQQFEAYLKLRGLEPADAAERQAALDEYLERDALAATIEQQDALDTAAVRAEVDEFHRQTLISKYFEQYLRDRIDDEAITDYYNTRADEFESRQTRVAHILFRTHGGMSEEQRRAKRAAAQQAYSKIRAGESFEAVAETYSEDTASAAKGGDLGWVTQGAVDKRFSAKVFSMDAGEVSEPFETGFGFHVVKVIEGPSLVKQPLEAVKSRIRHRLRTEAREEERKRLLEQADIDKG